LSHGNIKVAQEKAARAFAADHVSLHQRHFHSNKMVEQALLAPGDIMLSTETVTSLTITEL